MSVFTGKLDYRVQRTEFSVEEYKFKVVVIIVRGKWTSSWRHI